MDRQSGKREFQDYQVKKGNNIYKRTALGSHRVEMKNADQCPFFSSVNEEIRRINDEYLSDVKSHLEYYENSQRASIHLMKVAGLSAGQRFSFDIENIPVMIMVFAATYGKLGMNLKSFEVALERGKEALESMNGKNGEGEAEVTTL